MNKRGTSSVSSSPAYAELQVTTNFTFLTGGSHPHELVAQAKALGLAAIAVTDRNTLAGIVRAHAAAKQAGMRLIVGARLDLTDAPSLLCLPTDRAAYGRLCRLLSRGQMRAEKGKCVLTLADVAAHAEGQVFIAIAPEGWDWRRSSPPPLRGRWRTASALAPERHQGAPEGGTPWHMAARAAHPPPPLRGTSPTRGEEKSVIFKPPPFSDYQKTGGPEGVPPGGSGRQPGCEANSFADDLQRIRSALPGAQLYLAASHSYRGDDRARIAALAALADRAARRSWRPATCSITPRTGASSPTFWPASATARRSATPARGSLPTRSGT